MVRILKSKTGWWIMGGVIVFIVIVAGVLLWFGGTLSWSPLSDYFTVQGYHQGQCTILTSQLLVTDYFNQDTGNDEMQYAPDFTFLMQDASHKSYHAKGYGIDQHFTELQDAQAILNSYHTQASYACWYDAGNPSHALLTRDVGNWALLIPGLIMLLIGLGIPVGAIIILRRLFR